MGRYAVAVAILTSSLTLQTNCFSVISSINGHNLIKPQTGIITHHRRFSPPSHILASIITDTISSSSENDDDGKDSLINSTIKPFTADVESEQSDESDDDEVESVTRLRRKALNSSDNVYLRETFEVKFPITKSASTNNSPIGLAVVRVRKNRDINTDLVLNLDTLRYGGMSTSDSNSPTKSQFLDVESFMDMIDDEFDGVVVSSVVKGSIAWNAGVRVSDVIVATSATIGDQLWPKSTLDGVRSSLSSRKVLNSYAMIRFGKFRASYAASKVTEKFELFLKRPIGIEVKDADNGFVEVTAFTDDAIPSTRSSLQIGDRITAVDNTLGSEMWPVSNVEGLVSSCTTRLPGQPIRFRFERVISVGEYDPVVTEEKNGLEGAVGGFRKVTSDASASLAATDSNTHKLLLSRCRDILRRYSQKDTSSSSAPASGGPSSRGAMQAVPTLVADRILETLADANAPLDSKTLALIMNSYLSSRAGNKAITAFEAAVGLSADGSQSLKHGVTITRSKSKTSKSLVPSLSALNIFTATALLRAHALRGDISSACRVLAAIEGKPSVIGGIESAVWAMADDVTADTRCYNIVLAAAAKAGGKEASERALELFNAMQDPPNVRNQSTVTLSPNAVIKSEVSYNTMISLFAKEKRLSDALNVFYDMRNVGIRPDKFTYTSVLKALVAERDFNGAEELLQEMRAGSYKPDVVTYNTLIKGLCDSLLWFRAKGLITEMEGMGVKPNSMTYGLLMNGLLKVNKPDACLTLFESAYSDARTSYLTENIYLYTTAITAASRLGDYERALDLLGRMKAVGVKPNIKTLTALTGALLSAKKPDLALSVYNQIQKSSVKPDGYSLSIGIKVNCESGLLEDAASILTEQRTGGREMSGRDVMFGYNYLIGAALKRSRFDVARAAMTELLESGYIPSKLLYKTMLFSLNMIRKKDKYNNIIRKETDLEIDENDRFQYLLFVLDSIRGRNLECDGGFYSLTVQEGFSLGGNRRKLVRSIVSQRVQDTANIQQELSEDVLTDMQEWSWEAYFDHLNESGTEVVANDKDVNDEKVFPPVRVRITDINRRQLFMAEKRAAPLLLRKGKNKKRRADKWTASSVTTSR